MHLSSEAGGFMEFRDMLGTRLSDARLILQVFSLRPHKSFFNRWLSHWLIFVISRQDHLVLPAFTIYQL